MDISDLPPEILGEIFCHCSRLWPDAPFSLSLVSRLFFHVTQTMPTVWTNLEVSSSLDETNEQCVQKIEHWFSRAGTCSVHVLVEVSRDHSPTLLAPPMETTDDEHKLSFAWPVALKRHTQRIGSLTLRALTHDVARRFLSAVYGPIDMPFDSFTSLRASCLRSLTLDMKREPCAEHSMTNLAEGPNPIQPIMPIYFPSLSYLQITNHALPSLRTVDISKLEVLIVVGPLRAPPLAPELVLDILRGATNLARFEFESRLLPDEVCFDLRSIPQSLGGIEQADFTSTSTNATSFHLITLRNFNYLGLRANNIPSILSRLVVPGLKTLRVEDLDGMRPNAAHETVLAFRHLLVRMDSPHEGRVGVGLRELDLVGVCLQSNQGKKRMTSTGGGVRDSEDRTTSHWSWCLRKMIFLQRLQVKKVNVDALFDLLLQGSGCPGDATNGLTCSRLEIIRILAAEPPLPLLTDFRKRRPRVTLIVQGANEKHNLVNARSNSLHKMEFMGGGEDQRVTEGRNVATSDNGGFGFGSLFDRLRHMG